MRLTTGTPPTIESVNEVGWRYASKGLRPPTFPAGSDGDTDADTGSESNGSGGDGSGNLGVVTTAIGEETYERDWDVFERAGLPQLAAAKLLLAARIMADASRWWTMRWPQNAVSLLSRACSLDTGKTAKLFRKLREITIHYVTELWQADSRQTTG